MTADASNAFGRMLRAARLGYHRDPILGAWVRVDAAGPPYRVDVVPYDLLIPAGPHGKPCGEHVVWWEGGPESLAPFSPALRQLSRPVTAIHHLLLNDDGELCADPPALEPPPKLPLDRCLVTLQDPGDATREHRCCLPANHRGPCIPRRRP